MRTPLTLILGPLSYILNDPDAWEKEEVKEQLLVMQQNGKNLLGLVEEILDLSKLEANKLELREEPTLIIQLLEHVYSVYEPQFKIRNIDFALQVNLVKSDFALWLDRKKIEQVLSNFLSNAIKFTNKGGRIWINFVEKTDQILFVISDTGKGVHADDLPFIFERFYQSKQANQKLYGGTGIGLALVSEYAKLMGGKVYAESELNVGSHFYFEIPKKIASIEEIDNYELEHAEVFEEDLIEQIGHDFTILVVEDNQDMREFVSHLLQKKYKAVLTANNGAEGLQLLTKEGNNIQLIISDIMMPEVDGLAMIKEVKSNRNWNGIPVIMLTALAAERDKLNALTIGVDDYLTKPFSVNELLIRAQNLLYNYHQRLQTNDADLDDELTVESETPEVINNWIKEVELKIKNSLQEKVLDVDALAEALFIGSRQLTRRLKNATGLTPSRFIREVQLQGARKALEDGKALSIKEVCFNHGFEQLSTFSKLFKKRFGKNPSDYLK